MRRYIVGFYILTIGWTGSAVAANVIEKQLAEIGTVPHEEVVIVQRKYTTKNWRHEISPLAIGGIPFGTVRRTLVGGASYTLHLNDWFALEPISFLYNKSFFSGFTEEVNAGQIGSGADCQTAANGACIEVDYQKLLYFLTTGVQLTPFYGKLSSFSRWIAYIEPYFSAGVGFAKTETNQYVSFFPGIGLRAYFREWFSMRLEFRDYIFSEKSPDRTATSGEKTTLRNNYAIMLAFSFWLPKMPR